MEGLDRGRRADERTGGRPGLGGCNGLTVDPNDDYEDILKVLMKCRCRKCLQTQHLDKK